MSDGPFFTMDDMRREVDSWGVICRQYGAMFHPVSAERFCEGC